MYNFFGFNRNNRLFKKQYSPPQNYFPQQQQPKMFSRQLQPYNPFQVKKVVLFTNARDEKKMREWAAHHLLLGFSLIYIFDHKSIVPLKDVFKNFDKRVLIERCDMNNSPKLPLMNKATQIATMVNADWFIYLDADEFLMLNKINDIKQLLAKYYFADSLAINWVMFGTNYHVKEPEGLILENYTRSDIKYNQHVKTFVRPSRIASTGASNPHFYNMINPNKMFAITGNSMAHKVFNFTNKHFWMCPAFIAHYIYQSEETYKKRKINLPADDTGGYRIEETDIHDKYNATINFIPYMYVEKVKNFLKQYQ